MYNKIKIAVVIIIILASLFYYFQDDLLWKNVYPLAYEELVWESSDKYQIDPYLMLAIMKVESKFNSTAVSNKGALGLMQLMPDTAKWIAKQNDTVIDEEDLYDPKINIAFSAWYLNNLINQFESEVIAIAAYNAGQGNIQRWLEQGLWNGTIEDVENIPFAETRSYVMRVSVAWWKYKEIYGK